MKHVFKVSAVAGKPEARRNLATTPQTADAKTDLLNAVYNAWTDFVYQKKNELTV